MADNTVADNTVAGKATRSGCKSIPTLKRKAVEVLQSVKTAVTHKKKTADPAKKKKVSTSKKGKDRVPPPSENSDVEVNFLTCYGQKINVVIRLYPQMGT